MRREIEDVLHRLLSGGTRSISLDEVSEAVGTMAITQAEIAMILDGLESRGCVVGDDVHEAPSIDLIPTLRAARELRDRLRRTPRVDEIAAHAHLDPQAVRRALFFSVIVQRS